MRSSGTRRHPNGPHTHPRKRARFLRAQDLIPIGGRIVRHSCSVRTTLPFGSPPVPSCMLRSPSLPVHALQARDNATLNTIKAEMATGSTALVNLLMIGVLVAQYLVVIVAGRLHPEARWLLLWSILYWSSYHCSLQSNPPRSMLSWCRPISMSLWTTVAYRASDGLRNRGCGVSRRNIDWIARPELSSAEPTGDPILWRHLMKRLVVWLATGTTILSLAALVAGCGAGGSVGGGARDRDDSKALQSKTWKATEIAGVESVLASKEFEATVKFTEGQMGGSATINRFNATYVTGSGNTIEVGEPVNTLMAGPPEAMAQEQAYLAAIQKAVAYEVTQDSLTLLDDEEDPRQISGCPGRGTHRDPVAGDSLQQQRQGGLESLAPEVVSPPRLPRTGPWAAKRASTSTRLHTPCPAGIK